MFEITNHANMQDCSAEPPVDRLQPSNHPSFRADNKFKSRANEDGLLRSDDDDSSSSAELAAEESLQIDPSSETSGDRTAPKNCASQEQDKSKEWMFHGNVVFPNPCGVDWDDDDRVPDEMRQEFPRIGEHVKASFSRHAPAPIEYIVIVSDIEQVTTEKHQGSSWLIVPIRGYVATRNRVNREAWADSIPWCDTDETPLNWTKITGGIRCWSQFIIDREHVSDPASTVDVLTMWGNRSYFDARGRAWVFEGKITLPPQTSEDEDIPHMAREAFHAAAGLPHARPSGIKFLAVHCDITELLTADPAHERRVLIRGFLQASESKSYKWETWLPYPCWIWRPLRGGLGGNEDFESASIEVKTESSKWLEIIVDGKLGKNNAGRLADAKQAHAANFFRFQFGSEFAFAH